MAKKKTEDGALAVIESKEWPVLATDTEGPADVGTMLQELGVSRFDLDKVSVPSGGAVAFEIESLGGVEYEKELRCIIAFSVSNQRSWYRLSLEEGDGNAAPDCASEDGLTGFGCVTLNEEEEPASHDCASCPHNQFGTARSGAGKACGEKALLYAFNETATVPFVIQVATKSLKPVKKYALKLMGHGRQFADVVTKITLEKHESPTPHAVMAFGFEGDLEPEARERMAGIAADLRKAFAPKPGTPGQQTPRDVNEMD